jgi:ATP-binding cassette, subfamily F, member 3
MKPIADAVEDRTAPFIFPQPQKMLASPLLRMDNVTVGYTPDKPILRNLSLRIDQDDRIALLGQNGNGKSTFAKLIAGKLAPLSGEYWGFKKVDVGYFAQHQLDELAEARTPYSYAVDLLPDATEAQRRARLGVYGFSVEKANTKCDNLSGGEKARLLLMLTAFHGPHLIILDEPTNHLDVDSREALIRALNDFEGAVILISHDRHLVDATADRLWIVRDGTVKSYDGDMEQYRNELLAERGGKGRTKRDGDDGLSKADRAEQRRLAADKRADTAPLRKAMQAAETKVTRLTAELAALDAKLADTKIYADAAASQKLMFERGQTVKRLAEAETAWLAATEAFEATTGT